MTGAVGLLVDDSYPKRFQLFTHFPRHVSRHVTNHRGLLIHGIREGSNLIAVVDEVLALGGNSIDLKDGTIKLPN